jgi:pyruvate-formate lyase
MDNFDYKKFVFNGKAKITKAMTEDYSFQKISEAYAQQGIKVTPFDVGFQVRGYSKMLDELKDINGRNFKPKSFEEYVKNGASVDETLDLFARGAFDGCIAL